MAGRSDAVRNRARLVEAALAEFSGAGGPVALEAVARRAGVGIGTLYRHFPTREALVEAVYGTELDRLCDEAATLLAAHEPDAALRAWMGRYADFVATKRGMAGALRSALASGTITSTTTRERLSTALAPLLDAGARAGALRADVPPADVTAALAGIVLAGGSPDEPGQVDRLLDLLVDGLRPR